MLLLTFNLPHPPYILHLKKERQMTIETNTEHDTVNQNDTHVMQEQNRNNTIQENAEVSADCHNVEPGLNTTKEDKTPKRKNKRNIQCSNMKSGGEYLNSLAVTKINTEKKKKTRNRLPSVVGHMGNETNLNILREHNTRKETKEQNIKKETADKTTKKRKTGISLSPKPGTSGMSKSAVMEGIPFTDENDSDNSDIDDIYDDVPCCICKPARPPEFNNANYLVITQWTQSFVTRVDTGLI